MAIYSCNLKSIGRSTHQPGTAGAHIRYVSRPDADPQILAEHMPTEQKAARNWMDVRERALRSNGRVIDKIRLALPRELDEDQRAALVKAFMDDLGGGRVPWYAAIHQRGKDAHNPHVHIAVHDRAIDTGRRLLRLSDNARDREKAGLPGPKAVEWIRARWEDVCNAALERAGHDVRIDRRTLQAQGIDRIATVHEGPRAQHINDNVRRPESRPRVNGCGREIDYPSIDLGRTRREFNAQIIDLNLKRAERSKNPATSVWALFEKEQLAADRALEERLAKERRARTKELRLASAQYLARIKRLRAERNLNQRAAVRKVRARFEPKRDELRRRQADERAALTDKQTRLHMRIISVIDITGTTRRRQEAARKALSVRHRQERVAFRESYLSQRQFAEQAVKERYAEQIRTEQAKRLRHVSTLKEHHRQAEHFAENARQQREIEREHMRQMTDAKITAWQRESREEKNQQRGSKLAQDFADAVSKARKKEAERPKERGRERDRGRSR